MSSSELVLTVARERVHLIFLKVYKFSDAYPTNIGQIQLDYDAANQIETFDVEFTYNYFTSNTGTDTDGSTFGVNLSVDTPIGSIPFSL
jgi:hypothetical protein